MKEISITGIFTTVVALVCIVFTSLLGYKLSKQITDPLNRLVDKMKMAESGNLTVKVQESGTGDEIDVLCTSFNNMISQINELIKSTKSVVDVVKDEVENIKYMSNQTYEISNGVSTAMQDIASGTLEQVNELESTSETMDSLAKSINKIIVNVESVNSISKDTKKIGDDSLKVVKELRDKTDNTNIIMDDINKHIAELVESIKEVEKVIYIIEDINEQTNLLSLNAGIEAARAGESGKGFLVVADEVKKLAEQSKNSTSSVYEVIKNINYKASSAINLIETSKKAFEEQRDAVDFTNSSFENVIKATEKIGNQLNVIYSFTKGIDEQKEVTLNATNNIKSVTETSSANTEEVLAATEEQTANAENLEKGAEKLSSTVEGLENSINRFKVEE